MGNFIAVHDFSHYSINPWKNTPQETVTIMQNHVLCIKLEEIVENHVIFM